MLNKSPSGERRILTATLLSTLLITALAGTVLIENGEADPMPATPQTVDIKVQSPVGNEVYNATNIPLQFYVAIPRNFQDESTVQSVQYWLDGKLLGQHAGEDLPKTYSVALTGLSDGEHSVKVWMSVNYFMRSLVWDEVHGYRERYRIDVDLSGSETISFTVATRPPSIRVLTSRKTFEASSSTADVPLNFTVNVPVSWVGYSLDGKNIVTVTYKVTLTNQFGRDNYRLVLSGLPVGTHSLTVYADDAGGNRGASEPFSFAVTQETSSETEQTSTPFPTATTAAAIATLASAVAVSAGLLFYFKKRKR